MKKKTTLQDMRDILVNSSEGSDRHIWGVVTRQNTNSQGKVTSYEVALGGDEGSMTCRKLAGAEVGDTVMVTLTKTGMAVVTGTVDGDKDAEAALTAAEAVQTNVDDLSDTVDGIEDLVGDGDESGITVKTQYYLSTSNTTPTGGSWQDTLPTYVDGRYYWTKTVTTYADGSEVESDPILDIASQLTAEVNSVVTAENQHFWHDNTGAYVTTANQSYTSGYAMKITTYGLLQTYNGNNLMSLTSSGLSFYQSDGNTPMATYSSAGATIYGGASNSYASFSSTGFSLVNAGRSLGYMTTSEFYYTGLLNNLFSMRLSSSGFNVAYNGSTNFRVDDDSVKLLGITISTYGSQYTIGSDKSFYMNAYLLNGQTIASSSTGDAFVADSGSIKNLWAVTNASSYTNNVHIGTAGRFFGVSGSSKRWKNSIEDIHDEALDPHHLYDIEVKQFKFNTDYIKSKTDQRYDTLVPGFIAEQIQDVYPIAVDINEEDGQAMDWNMKFIIPPMLALIQELNERVKSLERRS